MTPYHTADREGRGHGQQGDLAWGAERENLALSKLSVCQTSEPERPSLPSQGYRRKLALENRTTQDVTGSLKAGPNTDTEKSY